MKLTPSQQALKYAAAAGNASGAHLSDGDLSFFAAMLDVAVDAVRKGKPTPLGVTTSFIRAELATPDLINDRSINSKAIQCAADVGELAVALGAFGTSAAAASATAGMASPAVLVSGAGLVAQVFSTTVSCGSVAVDLTGAALVEVTEHFKAVSASISGLVAKCIEELNKNTEKHFKPENYRFSTLPNIAQAQLKDFLNDVRACLFFEKCELYLLITRKVSASTARKIAQGVILANKYERQRPPVNAVQQLNPREVQRVASEYTNKSIGAAFNKLVNELRV